MFLLSIVSTIPLAIVALTLSGINPNQRGWVNAGLVVVIACTAVSIVQDGKI